MGWHRRRWPRLTHGYVVAGLLLGLIALAGCGASTIGSAGPAHSSNGQGGTTTGPGQGQTSFGSAATPGAGQSNDKGPQYLIKALSVSMTFSDTRKIATTLQTWIASADPDSTSAGSDYQQVGDTQYRITMTFSVAASAYPHIYAYLAGYAQTNGGHLEHLQETVQDVSNDYVDTQSRLKNLRAEQDRLLALMSQATNLNDTLTIEQKLTDVEGQIEQIEAHLAALNGQTTFYNVTIILDPVGGSAPTPTPSAQWNLGQTVHDAFNAALAFGQGLLSVLVWLAFFAVYLIPVLVLFLLIRRLMRARAARRPAPALAPAVAPAYVAATPRNSPVASGDAGPAGPSSPPGSTGPTGPTGPISQPPAQ